MVHEAIGFHLAIWHQLTDNNRQSRGRTDGTNRIRHGQYRHVRRAVRRSISRDNSPGGWLIRCQVKRVRPGTAIGPESAPPPNGVDAAWVLCDFDDLL